MVLTPIPPPEMADDPGDAGLALPPLGLDDAQFQLRPLQPRVSPKQSWTA